jgi:heme o synthase
MNSSDEWIGSGDRYEHERHSFLGLVRSGGQTTADQIIGIEVPQTFLPSRLMDFVSLTKPEVLFLVLIATGVGGMMASSPLDPLTLFNALMGTALVAGGTAALNHYLERWFDGQMRRTANRPLPAGRLRPQQALIFGVSLSIAGTIYLAVTCNGLTSAIGVAALLSYLLLYTPLKRRSDLCTLVGAFPGAAPILMGWTAVRDDLTLGAWILYAILFFWQFPHFLAIGWMYREDYARARMLMIPQDDGDGSIAFRQVWIMSAGLIALTFFPIVTGMAGTVYLVASLVLALGLLFYVHRAASRRTNESAKQLLHATVIYLPLLLLVMVLDKTAPLYVWFD